jgi:hypothetical protein
MVPPEALLKTIIRPTLDWMTAFTKLPLSGPAAEVMLLATALQESGLRDRDQGDDRVNGPALGFWQFERIGVAGVLTHHRSGPKMINILDFWMLPRDIDALWITIENCDRTATMFARMLLWRHKDPLPDPLPEGCLDGWESYLDLWRPGKPHADRWEACWAMALNCVKPPLPSPLVA